MTGPVPADWMRAGVPVEAVITFREGFCPVHETPLAAGTVEWVGRQVPAGWCRACAAWWHNPVADLTGGGLQATWGPMYGPDGQAVHENRTGLPPLHCTACGSLVELPPGRGLVCPTCGTAPGAASRMDGEVLT